MSRKRKGSYVFAAICFLILIDSTFLFASPVPPEKRRQPLYDRAMQYQEILMPGQGSDRETNWMDRYKGLSYDYFHYTAECNSVELLHLMDLLYVIHGGSSAAFPYIGGCRETESQQSFFLNAARRKLFQDLKNLDLEGMVEQWPEEEKQGFRAIVRDHRKYQRSHALHPIAGLMYPGLDADSALLLKMKNHWRPEVRLEKLRRHRSPLERIGTMEGYMEKRAFLESPCEACDHLIPFVLASLDRMIEGGVPQKDTLIKLRQCSQSTDLENMKALFRVLRYFWIYGAPEVTEPLPEDLHPRAAETNGAVRKLLFQSDLYRDRTQYVLEQVCKR